MIIRRALFHHLATRPIPARSPLTPALSSASLFRSLFTKQFRLTRLFSVRSSHSCLTLFTLKPVSPAFATLTKSTRGYTPLPRDFFEGFTPKCFQGVYSRDCYRGAISHKGFQNGTHQHNTTELVASYAESAFTIPTISSNSRVGHRWRSAQASVLPMSSRIAPHECKIACASIFNWRTPYGINGSFPRMLGQSPQDRNADLHRV